MNARRPVYCCIPIEFIQPWDQNEAIRQVKELRLGNMVMIQGTFHVGNSDEDRRKWKQLFPHLAARIDATPRFPERPEHGMTALLDMPLEFRLQQLELCRELGLLMFGWILQGGELSPEEREHLRAAGKDIVFSEPFMCENLSILSGTLSLARLKEIDATPMSSHVGSQFARVRGGTEPSVFDAAEGLDFQAVHDWLVGRMRAHGLQLRRSRGAPLAAVEASAQMRLAMEAGADVPIFELVPSHPLRGLAATRGAAKAYGKDLWGVHAAMGYYRAPTDLWTPERLRIAYDLFFAGGASFFSEPNIALRNWGSCSAFFTIPASPPIRWAEEECRGFDDPVCVRGREVLAEHYRFAQFHERPERGPRVPFGCVLGRLDGWTGSEGAERMWLVDHPGFLAPEALATWHHFDHLFDAEAWYTPPRKYYWQADAAKPLRRGTPPCGQVDLVPIEAPPEVLQTYRCLVMLGWNTMTPDSYAKLKAFVEAGGTLLLAVPHLSTRTRMDQPQQFIREGDVTDLCGVRILGAGDAVEEVYLAEQTTSRRHVLAQGTLYLEQAPLAKLQLHGARTLAYPRGKPDQPVLLEHPLGKGMVYLLATWEYPGDRLDAFITDILRALAEAEQSDIAVESRDVFYALYDGQMPSGGPFSTVYLVNHDVYGQAAYVRLCVRGATVPVRVDGRQMRVAWVFDDLIVSPHDRFVKVTDARREGRTWALAIDSEPARQGGSPDEERLLQIELLHGSIAKAELDGRTLALEQGIEGDTLVRCRLSGPQKLRIICQQH